MRRLQQVTVEVAADVVAIQQVLFHYAYALDARDYDALDEVFSADAKLHTSGGTLMSPAQYKAMCATELPKLDATHHMVTNTSVTVDGDRANARAYFQAQHVKGSLAPDSQLLMAGWVDDEFERRAEGWRIVDRRWHSSWSSGNPAVLGR
jgi:3-phenylpropionate/cinnamic acid dioxygenase small subunit